MQFNLLNSGKFNEFLLFFKNYESLNRLIANISVLWELRWPGSFIFCSHSPIFDWITTMKHQQCKKVAGAILTATLTLAASLANADTYHFTQSGFDDHVSLVGLFEGFDNNHDGKIAGSEVSYVTATFFGGYYDGFSFTNRSNYTTVSYTLGSGVLGANSSDVIDIYARGTDIGYFGDSHGGRIYGAFNDPIVTTTQLALVSGPAPIPEPESWAMLLSGLGALAFLAKRKQAA